MAQKDTTVSDFKVAPRKPKPDTQPEPAALSEHQTVNAQIRHEPSVPTSQPGTLLSNDEEIRRERAESRAIQQEDSRLRLQDLKQNKARESKHFVNCPLNYDTKQRLLRASTENNVKMTKIIQTAIDQFLRDSGY